MTYDKGADMETSLFIDDNSSKRQVYVTTIEKGIDRPHLICSPIAWIKDGENLLLVLTLTGVIIGVVSGFMLRTLDLSEDTVLLIAFPGELLMQMLKCVIVPMIIGSICSSLVQLDPHLSGRMGLMIVVYYMCTTILAITVTLLTAAIIQPGRYANVTVALGIDKIKDSQPKESLHMMLDFFRQIIPENAFRILLQSQETVLTLEEMGRTEKQLIFNDSPNILGIVTCCVAFGLAVAAAKEDGRPIGHLLVSFNTIIEKLVTQLMWLLPFGVIFLVAGCILELEADIADIASAVGIFVGTSFAIQTIHFYVLLPILFFVITRKSPYVFLKNQLPAYANTIGHSSSTVALAITTHCIETRNHIDPKVAQFILPVGAAINVDGAALYEAFAVVFVGQMHRMDLGWTQILAILITVTVSSVGSSGLPGAGLVSILPLISPIPIRNSDVAMLICTDWLVDRFRTANNVMGDSLATGVIAYLNRQFMKKQDENNLLTEKNI